MFCCHDGALDVQAGVDGGDAADFKCPTKVNGVTKAPEAWSACQLDSCVYGM
jgi:hypothetical protein